MTNVVIVSAARTAVGSFNGSFANTPAHDLGAAVIEAVVARAGVDKAEVSETILGQVLTARNNLAVQLAVLQRAQAFIGTYGGLAQLALRAGKPALAFYTTWGGTAFAHVDLTHRFALASGVPFHLVQAQALEQLHELWP